VRSLGRLTAVALVSLLTALLGGALAPWDAQAATAEPITPTNGLKLTISSLAPRQVTADTPNVVVNGTVTNISDRQIDNIKVRLQLGAPVTDDGQLSAALAGAAPTDRVATDYQTITATLRPGQTASISVLAQLHGAGSLQINQPGVYPMLVNVQGQPAYGGQARLAAANLLLPVLSAPGGGAPHTPGAPDRLTLLWPLVDDRPRVVGTANGQPVLSDDSLADSLVAGGRLFGLVQAVKDASANDPALLSSMCFASDHGQRNGRRLPGAHRDRQPAGHRRDGRRRVAEHAGQAHRQELCAGAAGGGRRPGRAEPGRRGEPGEVRVDRGRRGERRAARHHPVVRGGVAGRRRVGRRRRADPGRTGRQHGVVAARRGRSRRQRVGVAGRAGQ
jgi:hypothetical protein